MKVVRRFGAFALRTRSCGVLLAAALALGPPAPARADGSAWLAKNAPMRIMALGDSITAGVGAKGADLGTGGYRGELARLLDTDGYRYAMVGNRSDYGAHIMRRNHEGWPGYVLRSIPSDPAPQLYGAVTRHALEANDPDVILLMAGTNDLLRLARRAQGYTLPHIVASMDDLLAQIFFLKPGVVVLVAGVVDSPNVHACDVARFDGAKTCGAGESESEGVPALVLRYARRGFRIAFVAGMSDAVPRDKEHFPDGIHPSGVGSYDAMARIWAAAIAAQTANPKRDTLAGR